MPRMTWNCALLALTVTAGSTGCATMNATKSLVSSPQNAWMTQEPTPLTVVVQRAEVASTTADEVERLMFATPTTPECTWPSEVQVRADDVAQHHKSYEAHPYYAGNALRIMPAVYWASALPKVASDSPAEGGSLLHAISPELSAGYDVVLAKLAAIGAIKQRIAAEEAALDQDELSDADEAKHEANVEALELELEQAEAAFEQEKLAFAAKAEQIARTVPAETRDRYAGALAHLRVAVNDASEANDAAALRYPLVVGSSIMGGLGALKEELVGAAKASASDYVFEKTGKRIDLRTMQVELAYEDGKVDLTLGGLSATDLDKIAIDELIAVTLERTQAFAGKAVLLLDTAYVTGKKLELEANVLDKLIAGFESQGWNAPAPAKVQAPVRIAASASVNTSAKAAAATQTGGSQRTSLFGL